MNLDVMSKSERIRLQAIPVLFGIGLMVGVPRVADLKANLGLNNGTFGTLISCGAIGALSSLFLMGNLVHRIGIQKTMRLFSASTFLFLLMWPHLHSPFVFFFVNIGLAFSFSAYNIAIFTHVLARQKRTGTHLLGLVYGGWSSGVLITTVLALAITSKVSFAWHVDSVVAFCLVSTQWLFYSLRETFTKQEDEQVPDLVFSPKAILINLSFDKSLTAAFTLGTMIEFTSADWATLLAHQEFHYSKAISIIPGLIFLIAMILGRVFINRMNRIMPERFWMIFGSLTGSIGFLTLVHLAYFLHAKASATIVMVILSLGFAIAGFGTSYMSAIFTSAGMRRNKISASTIVSRMNFSNVLLAFIAKLIVAAVAQRFSILAAFTIPALMLLSVSFFSYIAWPKVIKD